MCFHEFELISMQRETQSQVTIINKWCHLCGMLSCKVKQYDGKVVLIERTPENERLAKAKRLSDNAEQRTEISKTNEG